MPLFVVALALFIVLAFVAFIPLSMILRYRTGTARRQARRWMMTVNVVFLALSVTLFMFAAAITTVWVPDAFSYALAGLGGGVALGMLGLLMSRWEVTPHAVYYTPSRWLVLAITLVVFSRLVYGAWRAWQAWQFTPDDTSWLAAAGAAGSLAAGAVVLGYYLAYWIGVRVRLGRAPGLRRDSV